MEIRSLRNLAYCIGFKRSILVMFVRKVCDTIADILIALIIDPRGSLS